MQCFQRQADLLRRPDVELEDGGEFSTINYRFEESAVGGYAEIHSFTALLARGGIAIDGLS